MFLFIAIYILQEVLQAKNSINNLNLQKQLKPQLLFSFLEAVMNL